MTQMSTSLRISEHNSKKKKDLMPLTRLTKIFSIAQFKKRRIPSTSGSKSYFRENQLINTICNLNSDLLLLKNKVRRKETLLSKVMFSLMENKEISLLIFQ